MKFDIQIGMGGALYSGFQPSEIESALRMYGISEDKRMDVARRIKIMEDTAIHILNERVQKK